MTAIKEPTEPGFYRYSGGRQTLIFLLKSCGWTNQWYVIADFAEIKPCSWSYIEQALSVWDLVKIEGDGT